MMPWLITVRAQLATYLLFLLTLLVLGRVSAHGVWPLWKLPLLFFIWANLHGGFLAGLGVLLVWAVARLATVWVRGGPSPGRCSAGIAAPAVRRDPAPRVEPFSVHLFTFFFTKSLRSRP